MLSRYARAEWLSLLAMGTLIAGTALVADAWPIAPIAIALTLLGLALFRDPDRRVPTHRGIMVSPADGRVTDVTHLDDFPPFGEGATRIRIFIRLRDAHINRAPCHGRVQQIDHRPGRRRAALNPRSFNDNEATLILIHHAIKDKPVAAVRLIAGMVMRTIRIHVEPNEVLQRGQRLGLIKLGSLAELYIPDRANPVVQVEPGQRVLAGESVLARIQPASEAPPLHADVATYPQPAAPSPAEDEGEGEGEGEGEPAGQPTAPDGASDVTPSSDTQP